MSTGKAKEIVKKYAQLLKEKNIKFQKIYLYGSHANAKAKKHSDIDIAVVVNKTGDSKKYLNGKMDLWELAPQVDSRIEPVLLEKDDFKPGMATIMAEEVKKHGIRIA